MRAYSSRLGHPSCSAVGAPGTSLTAKETVPSNLAAGVVQSVAVDAATPNAHPRPNAFGNAVLAWATIAPSQVRPSQARPPIL